MARHNKVWTDQDNEVFYSAINIFKARQLYDLKAMRDDILKRLPVSNPAKSGTQVLNKLSHLARIFGMKTVRELVQQGVPMTSITGNSGEPAQNSTLCATVAAEDEDGTEQKFAEKTEPLQVSIVSDYGLPTD